MQRQPCAEPMGVGSGIGRVALDDHVEVVDCGFQSEHGEKGRRRAAHGLGWRPRHPAGFAVHLCRWNPELKMIRRGSRMLWNPPITHLSVDRRRSRVHGSGVCGGNIDARNGAQPVRLAFGSDLAGAEVFIIAGRLATDPRTGGARPPPPSLWCVMQRAGRLVLHPTHRRSGAPAGSHV
jgi:hypothetical protein